MNTELKTDTEILIIAMRHWAKVVLSNGGVAADTISEGADRLQELQARAEKAEAALATERKKVVDEITEKNAPEIVKVNAHIVDMTARAEKSEKLWKEFITLMEITEESDSGYEFNPNKISSCRAIDGRRLNEILNEARGMVFNAPKE